MLSYYDFVQNKMFDDEYRQDLFQEVKDDIERIQFFDETISNIEFQEEKFYELFSDQEKYDSLRKEVQTNFYEYFNQTEQLDKFMLNSQNQLSNEQTIISSQLQIQNNQDLKITYNLSKQYDIEINNLNLFQQPETQQVYCYFQNSLDPNKKQVFRVRSQSFLSGNTEFVIGLMQDFNLFTDQAIVKPKTKNNTLNTFAEEIEFRIHISKDIFEARSYPSNNLIYQLKTKLQPSKTTNQFFKPTYQFGIKFDKFELNSKIKVTYFSSGDDEF
ncbi:hypothetical protein ABPG72_009699 [Tetrahymena utriculariae]